MRSIAPGEELVYEWQADYAGVDVPLWDGARAPSHRERHDRDGHRRAGGRLPAADARVRVRPERVVPRPQGEPRPSRRRPAAAPPPTTSSSTASRTSTTTTRSRSRPATGPGLRPRRRPVHRQLVPRGGHDLRPGHQGRHPARAGNDGHWGAQAVDLSPAQGAIVEFTPTRGRAVPDGHPRVQLRRSRRPRAVPGRRRRSDQLSLPGARGRSPARPYLRKMATFEDVQRIALGPPEGRSSMTRGTASHPGGSCSTLPWLGCSSRKRARKTWVSSSSGLPTRWTRTLIGMDPRVFFTEPHFDGCAVDPGPPRPDRRGDAGEAHRRLVATRGAETPPRPHLASRRPVSWAGARQPRPPSNPAAA